MAGKWSPCFTISFRISHLGAKPARGGRPPRESNNREKRITSIGDLAQEVESPARVVD